MCLTYCAGNKRLLGNPGFDSADAWESGYLPCALEDVVFPENYHAVLPLPAKVDISGFVLPREGAILLSDESTITLGGEMQERECENGRSRRAYLKVPATRKWYDPSSWVSTAASQAQNTAIPHLERVPCDNETVVLQRNGPLSVDLENTEYLRMGHLNLAGSLISSSYLNYLLPTDIGQLLFKNSLDTLVQYYHQDTCGCQMEAEMFMEPVCKNVMETCERPHCLVPVIPLESCCPICGSVLRFKMEYCSEENLNKLRKVIVASIKEQELTKFGLPHQLREHAAAWKFPTSHRHHQLEMIISGRPYNPNITFASILLIILCLAFVSVVALVIFAHYVPEHRYLRYVPQWVYDPRRWRTFLLRPTFMFARFDNITGGDMEADITDGITIGYDAESGQVRERAFDNPMFGEKLKEHTTNSPPTAVANTQATTATTSSAATAVVAAASMSNVKQAKLGKKSSGNKLENVTLVDAMEDSDVEEEQELTEIPLEDVSGNDSEAEEETKE
ncbi:unnamed protein product [Ceratitis capitata]|uniref:Protein amnionless n=1 Tax=Ceratitis capitata TaxID=7213 RepID=A0A811UKD7_CERCA|nr:unnamed protein product [Ceratitis capitata]